MGADADPQTLDVLDRWESVLSRLAADPMLLARELDWVAKLELLQGYRDRDGLGWDSARLQAVDLQYSDVRPDKGLYHRLVARGRMERLLTDAEVERAVTAPPEDTRAYFRGECLRRYADDIAAASWDSVIFDVPGQRLAAARPDAGAAARDEGARRRAAGPLPDRRRPARGPVRPLIRQTYGRVRQPSSRTAP